MPDYGPESERAWDEYQWERFLQQQDHKTEKYMELLEKYLDDPLRDQIIAREMGWSHLPEEETWEEEINALLATDAETNAQDGSDEIETPRAVAFESFEDHGLYRASFALTVWLDKLFDDDATLQNEPAAIKLATYSALASAKLAAALSDNEVDEIGMTIAYLKRALKAITISLEAAASLRQHNRFNSRQYSILKQRLFVVRDGVISLMGEYRGEWLRRYGGL